MDSRPFRRMTSRRFDVAVLFDYRDPEWRQEFSNMIAGYPCAFLAAWSMGVWAAGRAWPRLPRLDGAIAINGTPSPIDRDYGIDPAAFEETLQNLPRLGCRSFYNAMFSEKNAFEAFYGQRPDRPFAEQHEELIRLRDAILAEPRPSAAWNAAVICTQDRIIPAKSQLRFWRGRAPYQLRKTGHFPFYLWGQWEDMIDDADAGQAAGPSAV